MTILCLFPREKFTKPLSEIDELFINYFTDQFPNGFLFPDSIIPLISIQSTTYSGGAGNGRNAADASASNLGIMKGLSNMGGTCASLPVAAASLKVPGIAILFSFSFDLRVATILLLFPYSVHHHNNLCLSYLLMPPLSSILSPPYPVLSCKELQNETLPP